MSQARPEHKPQGDPCTQCGVPASSHRVRTSRVDARVAHEPIGDPCALCGLNPKMHRKAGARAKRGYRWQAYKHAGVIGIDGEGFEHGSVYAYLCAATVDDEVDHVERIQ